MAITKAPVSFLLVLLCAQLAIVMSTNCTISAVMDCSSNLAPHVSQDDLKYYTEDQLQLYCDARPLYDLCLDGLKPHCNKSVLLFLEGNRKYNEYLCSGVGFEAMRKYSDCYKKDNVQNLALQCEQRFTAGLTTAQTNADKCDEVKLFLSCYKDGIARACGEDAGEFMFQANMRTLQPVYSANGCSLDSTSPASGAGLGTASLCAVAVSTLLSICIVMK